MEQDNLSLEEKPLPGCANCGHMVVEQGYPHHYAKIAEQNLSVIPFLCPSKYLQD
jgi:hypothetical protein